jgi:hypothetical protein
MKDEVILKQMRQYKLNGHRGERRALEKMKLVCVKWEGLDYLCHEVKKEKRKNSVVLIRKGTLSRTKNKYSACTG